MDTTLNIAVEWITAMAQNRDTAELDAAVTRAIPRGLEGAFWADYADTVHHIALRLADEVVALSIAADPRELSARGSIAAPNDQGATTVTTVINKVAEEFS